MKFEMQGVTKEDRKNWFERRNGDVSYIRNTYENQTRFFLRAGRASWKKGSVFGSGA